MSSLGVDWGSFISENTDYITELRNQEPVVSDSVPFIEQLQEWEKEIAEKEKERSTYKWRKDHDPDFRERKLANNRRYRKKNKEKLSEYYREYYSKNHDKIITQRNGNRARKKSEKLMEDGE